MLARATSASLGARRSAAIPAIIASDEETRTGAAAVRSLAPRPAACTTVTDIAIEHLLTYRQATV